MMIRPNHLRYKGFFFDIEQVGDDCFHATMRHESGFDYGIVATAATFIDALARAQMAANMILEATPDLAKGRAAGTGKSGAEKADTERQSA